MDPGIFEEFDFRGSEAKWCILFLGILFITGFNAVALTVKHFGMSIAAVFQKLPFVASGIFAVIAFREASGWLRWIGISLCILAVILSYKPSDSQGTSDHRWWHWMLPILTFGTGASIEILFLWINRQQLWSGSQLGLTALIFGLGGVFGLIFWLTRPLFTARTTHSTYRIQGKEILAGILLGIPNFYSIYFLFLLLDTGWDGSFIFPVNNIGILFLSGIVGLLIFRERLGRKNQLGLAVALIGMILVFLST